MMKSYKARTKAGRAWIARILDNAIACSKIEIDLVTEGRSRHNGFPIGLVRGFIEIDGRSAELHEIGPTLFVYLTTGTGHRYATRYVIRTHDFDTNDLPEVL